MQLRTRRLLDRSFSGSVSSPSPSWRGAVAVAHARVRARHGAFSSRARWSFVAFSGPEEEKA
jgi:multimeric flavodoxin WrbA